MFALWLSALLHLYIGWRIAADLPGALPAGAFIVLMVTSAILIPLAFFGRRSRNRATADRASWAGMLALGLFSTLLVLTLLRDAMLLLAWPLGIASLAAWSAIAVPLLALAIVAIGFVNARRTARVRDVEVPVVGLPAALHGFTIAQISDIHVGPTIKGPYVQAHRRCGQRAGRRRGGGHRRSGRRPRARPRGPRGAAGRAAFAARHLLRHRQPRVLQRRRRVDRRAAGGWACACCSTSTWCCATGGAQLVMAGVADYQRPPLRPAAPQRPAARAAGAPAEAGLRVLLAHQPRSAEAAAQAGFDVQLSGHTHGGQFWPWNLFVQLQQPYTAGLHRLQQLWIYTSRGTGYWGPPLRLGAPSEITRLRFVGAA